MSDSFDRPEPELPPLRFDERLRLAEALARWAERHPQPDRPVFGYADGPFVSPRELAAAVREESDFGERFLRSVRIGLTEESFDTYLEAVERSARRPWWRLLLDRMLGPFRRPER